MIANRWVRLVALAVVAFVLLVGVRAVVGGFGSTDGGLDTRPASGGTRTAGVVSYVFDGDTVGVELRDGREVRVRFLGISAPEMPHPGKPGECYGQEATRHLEQLLPVRTHVRLVSDQSQDDVDAYGRRLRYVQAGGRDIGAAQIKAGAAAARESSSPVERFATYSDLEETARAQQVGMWTACN